MRSGIIEAAIDQAHYLVRFDELIGFTDGSKWPPSMAVVPLSRMLEGDDEDAPPPWLFFDDPDSRARYEAWIAEETPDRGPRIVPFKKPKAREP